MLKYKLTTGIFLFLLVVVSCTSNKKSEKETIQQQPSLVEVSIGGMDCTDCEQMIQINVSKLEGIKSIKASFIAGNAIVEYFPQQVDTIKIKEAIVGVGYTVKKFLPVQLKDTIK